MPVLHKARFLVCGRVLTPPFLLRLSVDFGTPPVSRRRSSDFDAGMIMITVFVALKVFGLNEVVCTGGGVE